MLAVLKCSAFILQPDLQKLSTQILRGDVFIRPSHMLVPSSYYTKHILNYYL